MLSKQRRSEEILFVNLSRRASEAGLLAPAAIGQAGHPDWKISLRLGDFSFKADGVDDLAGS